LRLSDHILAERGSESDVRGIFTSVANALLYAERFELSDDVALAAYNLTKSKPTTLLSALPLCRAPFRKMWLEWRGGITTAAGMIRTENKRDEAFAPEPIRQGCLIETDETGQRGTMTFAWVHKERIHARYSPVNIAPLGTIFDWSEDGNVYDDAARELALRYPTAEAVVSPSGICEHTLIKRYAREMSDDVAKHVMEKSLFHKWGHLAASASERTALRELNRHHMPWIPDHARGFFDWTAGMAMQSEAAFRNFLTMVVGYSWEADIEGEPPFAETVIAMMNSRNAIEHRPVDLTALNKSRAKRKKPLFLPYRTTHLRLSQAQTRAFRAGLLSREDAGRHRVRGHFKIRKTGVYWWSPFFRGDPSKPLDRREYSVT
jgi:hypothetical protein